MKFVACYENNVAGINALKMALKHARQWDAKIEVVQAVIRERPVRLSRLKELEESFEKEVAGLFSGSLVDYTVTLLTDDFEAGEQIVRYARRRKVDLIFLDIRKKSKVGKLLFGSNAQHIILNAHCPVMTVSRDLQL